MASRFNVLIILVLFACGEPYNFQQAMPPQFPISDNFSLNIISGENQKYVGFSPEPIRFQITDNENGRLLKSFDDVNLEGVFYSNQGDYYRESSTLLHSKIRNFTVSCSCFELFWVILPKDDPTIGPNPVSEVKIYINIFDTSFNEPIINSPEEVVHFVGD